MLFSINADAWVQTFSVKGKAPMRAGSALNAMLSAYMDLRRGNRKRGRYRRSKCFGETIPVCMIGLKRSKES